MRSEREGVGEVGSGEGEIRMRFRCACSRRRFCSKSVPNVAVQQTEIRAKEDEKDEEEEDVHYATDSALNGEKRKPKQEQQTQAKASKGLFLGFLPFFRLDATEGVTIVY